MKVPVEGGPEHHSYLSSGAGGRIEIGARGV